MVEGKVRCLFFQRDEGGGDFWRTFPEFRLAVRAGSMCVRVHTYKGVKSNFFTY
jgi:hypothetical protein